MTDLLVEALVSPGNCARYDLPQWDLLIRQARRSDLMATLALRVIAAGVFERLPRRPRLHLESARRLARRHREIVRWDVQCLSEELAGLDLPIVLLKGAAYVMADLPPAQGRLFSDVDILVPQERLAEVETVLLAKGWAFSKLDAYDQRYYRQWMHELPPMHHTRRHSSLDVHHNILPSTAVVTPDASLLLAAACPIEGAPRLRVLAPEDMVLHSAAHLFFDGELEHGLRDLVDLDALFRHFAGQEDFFVHLLARAEQFGLGRPLYYAAHYCRMILATPLPGAFLQALSAHAPVGIRGHVMRACLRRALRPDHVSCRDRLTGLARWLLYVRAHALRMPLRLLLPHLARKAWRARFGGHGEAGGREKAW